MSVGSQDQGSSLRNIMMDIMQLTKTVVLRCNNQMDDSFVGTIREKQYRIMEIRLQEQI